MLLPFTQSLTRTTKFDAEMAQLYDGHYSRQTIGSPQFMPPGFTYVLRNNEGTILFGWLYQLKRDDRQIGINCTVFRNTTNRKSSEIILECEQAAFDKWIPNHPELRGLGISRMFTYIDASKLRASKKRGVEYCHYPPGRCFLEAGWRLVYNSSGALYRSTNNLFLLEKVFA